MTEETDELTKEAAHRKTENPSLGTCLGHEVHIAVRRDPVGAQYPDDFAVNVYIPCESGENIDIVRVDTSHEGCHIDRLYLPEGHDQRKHDYGFSTTTPEGAVRYFTEQGRWRDWVKRYDENHGLP